MELIFWRDIWCRCFVEGVFPNSLSHLTVNLLHNQISMLDASHCFDYVLFAESETEMYDSSLNEQHGHQGFNLLVIPYMYKSSRPAKMKGAVSCNRL
jgi:hypothetical protein